jgi:hypothetical protein
VESTGVSDSGAIRSGLVPELKTRRDRRRKLNQNGAKGVGKYKNNKRDVSFVIARSSSARECAKMGDEAIHSYFIFFPTDCFASLAMTVP